MILNQLDIKMFKKIIIDKENNIGYHTFILIIYENKINDKMEVR